MDERPEPMGPPRFYGVRRSELVVAGELDVSSGEQLRLQARSVLRQGRDLAVDLSEVTFVDCGGVHALQQVCAEAAEAGRHASIRSPSPAVRRLAGLLAGIDRSSFV